MGYAHAHHRPLKPSRFETFFKNALVILNTIFVVFGFILFIYGCGGKSSTNREAFVSITENGGDIFQVTSNILIILGAILLMLGFWGLFGIHSCMKASIYVGLLIVLAIADIGLGFYATRYENSAKLSVENNLLHTIQILKTSQDPNDPAIMTMRSSWDALQTELKCCGIYKASDWFYTMPIAHRRIDLSGGSSTENASVSHHESTNIGVPDGDDFMRIPHSCFKEGDDGLEEVDFNTPISTDTILENVFKDGCLEKTVHDLDFDRIQRIGILMAVSKLLAVICAVILTCHLRNDKILVPAMHETTMNS